jgi:phosphocarrier protein
MASTLVTINHSAGLHARPATLFVQTSQKFTSDITVTFKEKTVNAKSLLSLLSLGIIQGSEININAIGDDSDDALSALSTLVAGNFGE